MDSEALRSFLGKHLLLFLLSHDILDPVECETFVDRCHDLINISPVNSVICGMPISRHEAEEAW